MNICLTKMTPELCHQFFKNFANDPAIFAPDQPYYEYQYSEDNVNSYWKKNQQSNRIHLAILENDTLVGEIILKKIDWYHMHCTLSIHMINDSVKNRGYGTEAERQAINYAKNILKMKRIYADTRIPNKRSQHVLEKVGFRRLKQDAEFVYYSYEIP